MSVTQPPLPPAELISYVGHHDRPRQVEEFERFGRRYRAAILDLLPSDWSFQGKRVLDFDSGSGRVLRHFLDEAGVAELHGYRNERIDPRDEREIRALRHNLSQVQREGVRVRDAATAERRALERSWSWRFTRPPRAVGRRLRRGAERRHVADTAR